MDIEKFQHLKRDINDFKLERRSPGRYHFSYVYPCIDKKNGKKYAIKFIEPTGYASTESYKLLTRKIIMQSHIKHHAILPLCSWGENCFFNENDEISFMVSPLMYNGSLNSYINEKRIKELDPTKKMIIIYGTAVGMKHLHNKGIIHRDLKLENILIDHLYNLYISDFSFSEFAQRNNDTYLFGSPVARIYTSPEIFEDDEEIISNKVDVYAFGIIIFNILTGKQFSEIKSIFKLKHYVLAGNRPSIPKEINEFYTMLIQKCWNQSPNDRPSFEEIVNLLEKPENLLPGANKKKFDIYKDYVNKEIPSEEEEEEDEEVDE